MYVSTLLYVCYAYTPDSIGALWLPVRAILGKDLLKQALLMWDSFPDLRIALSWKGIANFALFTSLWSSEPNDVKLLSNVFFYYKYSYDCYSTFIV